MLCVSEFIARRSQISGIQSKKYLTLVVSCEADVTGIAAILTALQIGVGLALLGRGLTAPHLLPVRVSLIAAGIVVIFLRIELFAA